MLSYCILKSVRLFAGKFIYLQYSTLFTLYLVWIALLASLAYILQVYRTKFYVVWLNQNELNDKRALTTCEVSTAHLDKYWCSKMVAPTA